MTETREIKKIVIVSDGTGQTAKRLMDAVLAQYSAERVNFTVAAIHQNVRTRVRGEQVLREIDRESLVIFSIISEDLRAYFHDVLEQHGILHLNVLEPMLNTMSKFLGVHPDYRPGLLQIIDDRYYRKIDAIGFTVEHDDGRGPHLKDADIVLLGLSRTCKTPISMYLSCNYGYKVANIPIIAEPHIKEHLLERLAVVRPCGIFGLMMQPEVLMHVREERSVSIGGGEVHQSLQKYRDLREIRNELKFCREFFMENDWEIIDVTRRAIEEISGELIHRLERRLEESHD